MDPLLSAFLSHLPDGPVRDRRVPQDLVALLHALAAAGAAAWPTLPVAPERFVAHLAARLPADAAELAGALEALHAPDLYLACACVDGVAGAAELFRAAHRETIALFVRGLDRDPAFADEVEQALAERLLVARDGAPARLAGYAGRGPLAGWVGVAAERLALTLRRGEAAQRRAHERAVAEQLSLQSDAELAFLKQRYRDDFQAAFARALAALGDRERTLLRLHVSGGLTLETIATMYRVNTSTVSRWLAATRERLASETEKDLRARLHLTPGEFASLARLLVTQLDLGVSGALAGDGAGVPGPRRNGPG